ncbi:hypothetical protein Tco_1246488 [Tanacetum coccineum]
MSEPMPTIPTQSPFTYPNPNSSASPSFTQDDTFMPNPSASPSFTQDDTFMPEPIQPMPTFHSMLSHNCVQHTHLAQSTLTVQQYLNNVVQTREQPKEVGKRCKRNYHCSSPPVYHVDMVLYKRENKVKGNLLLQVYLKIYARFSFIMRMQGQRQDNEDIKPEVLKSPSFSVELVISYGVKAAAAPIICFHWTLPALAQRTTYFVQPAFVHQFLRHLSLDK